MIPVKVRYSSALNFYSIQIEGGTRSEVGCVMGVVKWEVDSSKTWFMMKPGQPFMLDLLEFAGNSGHDFRPCWKRGALCDYIVHGTGTEQ